MNSLLERGAAAAVAALLLAAPATAWSAVSFSGSFSVGGTAFADPGLVVEAAPMNGAINFELEVGESQSFHLFDLWTDETAFNSDDLADKSISTSFSFTAPEAFAGDLHGTTDGTFLFFTAGGDVEWDNPLTLNFGDGGILQISLDDAGYNWGLFGLAPGRNHGASIDATVTLVSAPTPVPLPASVMLLAGALGGFGLLSFRRRPTEA